MYMKAQRVGFSLGSGRVFSCVLVLELSARMFFVEVGASLGFGRFSWIGCSSWRCVLLLELGALLEFGASLGDG